MSGAGGFFRLATAVLAAAVVAVLAACASSGTAGAPPPRPGVLANPIDPRQQTLVPWRSRSHWLQPWRAYLDTVPAAKLLDAIGINFNGPPAAAAATAKLLASSGFRRARVETGWGGVTPSGELERLADIRTKLLALKANGIRPLILLNAHESRPCPLVRHSLTVTEPARKGDRELTLEPAQVEAIVPGRTGLDETERGRGKVAAGILIESVTSRGRARLTKPLPYDVAAGPHAATTLAYQPFQPPLTKNGSPNPAFEETIRGWLAYVGIVTRTAESILGSERFDIEVWNELSFGSAFVQPKQYYKPEPRGKGSVTDAILARTVEYVRDPANGVSTIGIGNGFANTLPWPAGSDSPRGLTAIDKHPYPRLHRFGPSSDIDKGTALNALGQRASFVPTYTSYFPEFGLSAIQVESLVRDLSPYPTLVGSVRHGRTTAPAASAPPTMWLTEMNMNVRRAFPTLGVDAVRRIQAKAALRTLVAYVNKGASAVYFFAVEHDTLALVFPNLPGGGPTLSAIKRLRAAFGHVAALSATRPLSLLSVADTHGHVQFAGDGTPAHPPLYNRDVVAFLPFQATPNRYVVALYVMTRNVTRDLPPEWYDVKIGGLPGKWKLSYYDPMTNKKPQYKLKSQGKGQLTLSVPLTDSPRLLTLTRG